MIVEKNRYTGNTTESLAGLLIVFMVILTILHQIAPWFFSSSLQWFASVAAWLSALILIRRATLFLQVQVGILFGAGILMIAFSHSKGISIDPLLTANTNIGLLSMIAAVGFLRLVALPKTRKIHHLPVGRRAYLQTLISTGVFSSIINISAPVLIADRICQQKPLNRITAQSIIRVFCSMSNWSPFFGAMAAVLTYVSDAHIELVILAGLPISMLCITVVCIEAYWRFSDQLSEFVGYPLEKEVLLVPCTLLLFVVTTATIFPNLSILVLISICALTTCICLLMFRHGVKDTIFLTKDHIITYLPRMVGELSLFLSAGVFAVGMAAIIETGIVTLPISQFNAISAAQLLFLMIIAAMIGIHPIILISSITPLVMALNPNPTLLAVVYLTAWNLGTGSSYLSGTQLIFQGRYGIPSWKSAMWNWPYTLVIYLLSSLWIVALTFILK